MARLKTRTTLKENKNKILLTSRSIIVKIIQMVIKWFRTNKPKINLNYKQRVFFKTNSSNKTRRFKI